MTITNADPVVAPDRAPVRTPAVDALAAPAPRAAGDTADPTLLGAPSFAIGAIGLGLFLAGFRSLDNSLAGPLPIMIFTSGIGLMIATAWAIRRGQGPLAAVYGIFGSFWLSLSALTIGLTNNWFGPLDMAAQFDATANFLLTWFIALVGLTVASLRMPAVFTVMFVVIDLSLIANFLAVVTGSDAVLLVGTCGVFVFALVGLYLFASAMYAATGGRPFPLGSPLLKN